MTAERATTVLLRWTEMTTAAGFIMYPELVVAESRIGSRARPNALSCDIYKEYWRSISEGGSLFVGAYFLLNSVCRRNWRALSIKKSQQYLASRIELNVKGMVM